MFEFLINLILTGIFLQAQGSQQLTLDIFSQNRNYLPLTEITTLIKTAPQKNNPLTSEGVKITAKSSIVIDESSGKILYEQNAGEKRPIASLTKLMTALVFLDHNPGWEEKITISSSDYRPGAITYLIAGEIFSVNDVIHASLLASSNEATIALSRTSGLTDEDFVKAMNQKAKELGMTNSEFFDPSGLNTNNKSTAADVARMLRIALSNPALAKIISSREWNLTVINKGITRHISSTDSILGQSFGIESEIYQVEAGKTGYLDEAGYCFASRIRNQQNNKILTVVLGSQTINDRFSDTKGLAYWVFKNYRWQ